jgi:hypothetical protein
LLRSAAHLVPDSVEAKTLVAIVRLKEAYEPVSCPRQAERELFDSLELDPWNNEAADDLGLLYELSVNARPAGDSKSQVSADEATRRLDHVWNKDAPASPMALEIGMGTRTWATRRPAMRGEGA